MFEWCGIAEFVFNQPFFNTAATEAQETNEVISLFRAIKEQKNTDILPRL